jgi:hypothetical protein
MAAGFDDNSYYEEEDPIARWTPEKFDASLPTTPGTAKTTPSKPSEEEEGGTLSEWATYLNPCMLPNIRLFKQESERLDDIIANLPRNKSIFDADSTVSSVCEEDNQRQAPPRPTFVAADNNRRTYRRCYDQDEDFGY